MSTKQETQKGKGTCVVTGKHIQDMQVINTFSGISSNFWSHNTLDEKDKGKQKRL